MNRAIYVRINKEIHIIISYYPKVTFFSGGFPMYNVLINSKNSIWYLIQTIKRPWLIIFNLNLTWLSSTFYNLFLSANSHFFPYSRKVKGFSWLMTLSRHCFKHCSMFWLQGIYFQFLPQVQKIWIQNYCFFRKVLWGRGVLHF